MPLDQEAFKFPDEKKQEEKPDEIQFEIEGEGVPEVEVVDDTPPEDRGRAPMKEPPAEVTDEELAQYSDGVKKRIQHFSKGYHEERRAKEAAFREREEAVRLAQQLMEENKKLQSSQGQTQQVLLEQAKKVVENELTDAKRRLKEAYEAGDSDKMLEAQEALTAAKIRADRVNNFKPAPLQEEKTVVQPQYQQAPRVDTKAVEWQQTNKWFGTDKEMTGFALAVHEKLVNDEGMDPQSDEYYRRINGRLRQVFPDKFESAEPADTTQRRKSNVVASATRSVAPKKITLSASEVAIAKRLGIPLERYAREVAILRRNENG